MTSKLVGSESWSVKANGSCGRVSPFNSLAYRPQTISRMSRSAWRTLLFPAAFAPYRARTGTSCFLPSDEIRQSDKLLSVDAFMLMMAVSLMERWFVTENWRSIANPPKCFLRSVYSIWGRKSIFNFNICKKYSKSEHKIWFGCFWYWNNIVTEGWNRPM